ncbi:MAG: hypothetical protein HYZ28_26555 [Myxococcales bacterium]|nr:hypothetical protein [Myxococcales bacterium]
MRRVLWSAAVSFAVALAGCGVGTVPPHRASASQALTGAAELLEFEAPASRQELFRDLARTSQAQAGRTATGPVLFPIVLDGEVRAAPGFDARADLLQSPDAGQPLMLLFEGRWAEDRRDSLQGLSEREAVELVARSLLAYWAVRPSGPVQVDRAPGAPYAAAYMDGILRVNPAFVYMAASVGPASSPALQ